MNSKLEISLLYDFYGELLQSSQQRVVELYVNDDLSLSESAELLGISRQGVRDSIDKYGPGGGYAFGGGVPGMMDAARRVNEIVRDEVHWYGRKFTGYVD